MSEERRATLRPPVGEADHVAGPADASVTLVEYGDFQCPHCWRAHPIVVRLQKRLGADLRFVFRHFPVSEMHPYALHAAGASESVAAQAGPEAFWTMHHAIYDHQQESADALDDAHLVRYAAAAGADPVQVKFDLENETYEERVQEDFISGVRSGVNGTPTFFIDGVRFDGDWTDLETFAGALKKAT
jgi:protein-disulfide isomerase